MAISSLLSRHLDRYRGVVRYSCCVCRMWIGVCGEPRLSRECFCSVVLFRNYWPVAMPAICGGIGACGTVMPPTRGNGGGDRELLSLI